MPLSLRPGESVLWEGRPAAPIPGVILAIVFALAAGWATLQIAVSPESAVVLAFFAYVFLFMTLVLTIRKLVFRQNVRYYITNLRIVRSQAALQGTSTELPLENLATITVAQGILGGIRSIGATHFGSAGGQLVFEAVKHPEAIRETALGARSHLPPPQQPKPTQPPTSTVIKETVLVRCRQCGARYLEGTPNCLTCGANL